MRESTPDQRADTPADATPDTTLMDEQGEAFWEHLRTYILTPPEEVQLEGSWKPNGEFEPMAPVPYPPATEEQLTQTETELGFPLPPELRRFYAEIANGGRHIGWVEKLYGATGGSPRSRWDDDPPKTIGQLASHAGWRLHPRIEEALLRYPEHYVLVDSLSEGFLLLGDLEGYPDTTVLDSITGRVYLTNYPYWFRVMPTTGEERNITWLTLVAPSLSAWFDSWLGEWRRYTGHTSVDPRTKTHSGPLPADLVDTFDLLDPDVVWRGVYRFGPEWQHEQSNG